MIKSLRLKNYVQTWALDAMGKAREAYSPFIFFSWGVKGSWNSV